MRMDKLFRIGRIYLNAGLKVHNPINPQNRYSRTSLPVADRQAKRQRIEELGKQGAEERDVFWDMGNLTSAGSFSNRVSRENFVAGLVGRARIRLWDVDF